MTKAELAECVSESTGVPKTWAIKITNEIFETIIEQMACGQKVQIVGFGTFSVKLSEAREGRNPRTGDKIHVKAHCVPRFKPGKQMKDKVSPSSNKVSKCNETIG